MQGDRGTQQVTQLAGATRETLVWAFDPIRRHYLYQLPGVAPRCKGLARRS